MSRSLACCFHVEATPPSDDPARLAVQAAPVRPGSSLTLCRVAGRDFSLRSGDPSPRAGPVPLSCPRTNGRRAFPDPPPSRLPGPGSVCTSRRSLSSACPCAARGSAGSVPACSVRLRLLRGYRAVRLPITEDRLYAPDDVRVPRLQATRAVPLVVGLMMASLVPRHRWIVLRLGVRTARAKPSSVRAPSVTVSRGDGSATPRRMRLDPPVVLGVGAADGSAPRARGPAALP